MATTKPTRPGGASLGPTTTPDTLSDRAAQADLGQMDPLAALQIKVCEERLNATHAAQTGHLKVQLRGIQERYRAVLRELRERYRAITMEDFAKILVGLFGGFIIRAFGDKGIDAVKDTYVGYSIFFLLLCLVFLLIRYVAPSKRRTEIANELERIDEEI